MQRLRRTLALGSCLPCYVFFSKYCSCTNTAQGLNQCLLSNNSHRNKSSNTGIARDFSKSLKLGAEHRISHSSQSIGINKHPCSEERIEPACDLCCSQILTVRMPADFLKCDRTRDV